MNQNQGPHKAYHSTKTATLHMAMELSNTKWKLAFSDGLGNPSKYNVVARDLEGVMKKIERAKERFKLSSDVRVVSCYEAGRDGFWIHRWLESEGIKNRVVDASSIEVSRRKRRAKTDRLDVAKLLSNLIRYENGEDKVWAVVRVPSSEEEDGLRLHRELERLKKERTDNTNRIRSLLALHGIRVTRTIGGAGWQNYVESIECWDGKGLPPAIKAEILRESQRVDMVREQIKILLKEQKEALAKPNTKALLMIEQLMQLRGIGIQSSWLFVKEMFSWRSFKNGGEVGSFSGLTGTPYASGDTDTEQGISKAGNRRVRKMIVEISWGWLRFQPESKISRWFQERFGRGGKRTRKIGIVAVARKLLIALWHYVEHGQIPEGAALVEA